MNSHGLIWQHINSYSFKETSVRIQTIAVIIETEKTLTFIEF